MLLMHILPSASSSLNSKSNLNCDTVGDYNESGRHYRARDEAHLVRVKHDFSNDRARLREVMQTLIFGDDKDGDGIPDNTDIGTAFGQDDAEFSILITDRQLSALQRRR